MVEYKIINIDNGNPNYRGYIAPALTPQQYVDFFSCYERSCKSNSKLRCNVVENTLLFCKVKENDCWVSNSRIFVPPNTVFIQNLEFCKFASWTAGEVEEKGFILKASDKALLKNAIYLTNRDVYVNTVSEGAGLVFDNLNVAVYTPVTEKAHTHKAQYYSRALVNFVENDKNVWSISGLLASDIFNAIHEEEYCAFSVKIPVIVYFS